MTECAQREREVRRDRRLADAALPRRDRDLVTDAFQDPGLPTRRHRARHLPRRDLEIDAHIFDAADRAHGCFGIARELLSDVRILGREVNREADIRSVDLDVAYETERDDVARKHRESNYIHRLKHLFRRGHWLSLSPLWIAGGGPWGDTQTWIPWAIARSRCSRMSLPAHT